MYHSFVACKSLATTVPVRSVLGGSTNGLIFSPRILSCNNPINNSIKAVTRSASKWTKNENKFVFPTFTSRSYCRTWDVKSIRSNEFLCSTPSIFARMLNLMSSRTKLQLRRSRVSLAAPTTKAVVSISGSKISGSLVIGTRHGLQLIPQQKGHRHGIHLPSSLSCPYRYNLGALSYFSSKGGGGPPRMGSRFASGIGLLGAASVLLGKTKYVFAALKLTKLATLGSMVLTIGTYSMFFGLPYAAGMVGLILIHEIGHAATMYVRGIPFSSIVFVPFMGAAIAMKEHPRDAWEDAIVAAGGPALGSLGAGAVAIAAHMTQSQLLFALADFGFMINLFNLLPIGSMDGGRIAGAISKWVGVGGLGLGGILAYQGVVHNPIFYLILISSGYETFQRFYDPYHLPPNYYRISPMQRAAITGGYIALITALLMAMDANQKYRKSPEQLIREREMEKSWDMT